MKQTVKSNSVLKTIATTAVAVLIIIASSSSSFASPGREKHRKTENTIAESQVTVQYMGCMSNTYDFLVNFENNTGETFKLVITNDEGDVVYSKEYNDVHFTRMIQLVKDKNGNKDIHPTFIIREGKRFAQRDFSIER